MACRVTCHCAAVYALTIAGQHTDGRVDICCRQHCDNLAHLQGDNTFCHHCVFVKVCLPPHCVCCPSVSTTTVSLSNCVCHHIVSVTPVCLSPQCVCHPSVSVTLVCAATFAGSANVAAAASAVSNSAAADAASLDSSVSSSKADGNVAALRHAGNSLDPVHAPGSAVSNTDNAGATTKSAAALLAADPAAAKPAAALPAADPAAAKPAVSKATASEASSSAASGGHAAATAYRPAQPGAEPQPVSGSSVGSSEGEYEVVPGADYVEQLKDPKKRRQSSGFTCVVNI
ncbi:TPA: hypothetical protein ACH3X3_000478 [Trebouxia sp. C0006]